jgi:GWxTD domain-containing protein
MIQLRKIGLIAILFWLLSESGFSQFPDMQQSNPFFFDAVMFKSDNDTIGRLDVYVMVPYQSLTFDKSGPVYQNNYDLTINILDSAKKQIVTKKINRNLIAKDYASSLGRNAEFDYSQTLLNVPFGKFSVEITIFDNNSKKSFIQTRMMNVLNFSKNPLTISGVMLLSSIEEKQSGFSITPHISENIGDLTEGFFAFFEVYNSTSNKNIDFAYILYDDKGTVIEKSGRVRKLCDSARSQQFLKIQYPKNKTVINQILRIIALTPSDSTGDYGINDTLYTTSRTIKLLKTTLGNILVDLNKAVRQLKWVATNDEIEYIENAATQEEKQQRFDDFWKKIDPSPNTERNEAFEEYYTRIEYANTYFKSYTEGWRTDKGMVYVIYGKPQNIEKSNSYNDNRVYERWTYTNRTIIFIDAGGFGDFRLSSPPAIGDRYRYGGM